eukprot:UN18570
MTHFQTYFSFDSPAGIFVIVLYSQFKFGILEFIFFFFVNPRFSIQKLTFSLFFRLII